MFSLKDAMPDISTDLILSKISEEQIWKRYCTTFEQIDKSFCSDLYNDRNPDCRIYYNKSNKLVYKDFGNGDSHDCFSYIQAKYNCTFNESLRIIYNDFKLGELKFDIIPQLVLNNAPEVLKMSSKSVIEIVPQAFNLVDYNYWNQYEIPLTLLEEYNVFSCSIVYLHKNGRTIEYRTSRTNPIYAYRFCFDGKYSYKIYFPLADKKKKWLFSGGSENDIEGYDQLPLFGDNIILTKSLKDCMVYNLLGYPAIALQGETNKLKQELVNKLYRRFDNIIVNYDNDTEGIKGSKRLEQQYGFKYFYVDGEKDLSDFVKVYGLQEARQMINNKLEQLNDKN
jgi:hypothetical protein